MGRLGYYRRARQLHQAARRIVADHDGYFPRDLRSVRRLPGIGRYTAGAILSIAFDRGSRFGGQHRAALQPAAGLRRPARRRPARSCLGGGRGVLPSRYRPFQPGPDGTGRPGLPPAGRGAKCARRRGCVALGLPGGKTRSPVPNRGRNLKLFPRWQCSSAAGRGYMVPARAPDPVARGPSLGRIVDFPALPFRVGMQPRSAASWWTTCGG